MSGNIERSGQVAGRMLRSKILTSDSNTQIYRTLIPVSYTHLDVYKRQVQEALRVGGKSL